MSTINISKGFIIFLFSIISITPIQANNFSSSFSHIRTPRINQHYYVEVDMNYPLSPTAKEALSKGIPLFWEIDIQLKKTGFLWDNTVRHIRLNYQLKYHALLNLYSIKHLETSTLSMFSSLTSALHNLSKIRKSKLIHQSKINDITDYYLTLKIHFIREALPTPLRPLSYFNSQWALSSERILWQLQN